MGGPGAGLEAFLLAQGLLVFEDDAEPLGMGQRTRLGVRFQALVTVCHTMEAEAVQKFEGGMSRASIVLLSMEVACAAQVRVIDDGLRLRLPRRPIEVVGDDRGDALVGERPDGGRPGRYGFGSGRGEAAVQAHDAQAGAEALLGMGTPVQDGDDEAFGLRADLPAPALETGRRPFRVTAVGARHVLGIGAVAGAAVAPVVGGDALAAVEHLHGAGREAHVHLLADQGVGHRVQEARGLDVVVEVDPRQPPLGEDVGGCRQGQTGRPAPRPRTGRVAWCRGGAWGGR